MKLDPCPWCKKPPKVITDEEIVFCQFNPGVICITCCHATLVCAKEDAEEMWNWV